MRAAFLASCTYHERQPGGSLLHQFTVPDSRGDDCGDDQPEKHFARIPVVVGAAAEHRNPPTAPASNKVNSPCTSIAPAEPRRASDSKSYAGHREGTNRRAQSRRGSRRPDSRGCPVTMIVVAYPRKPRRRCTDLSARLFALGFLSEAFRGRRSRGSPRGFRATRAAVQHGVRAAQPSSPANCPHRATTR
jgi:hypothetical protein